MGAMACAAVVTIVAVFFFLSPKNPVSSPAPPACSVQLIGLYIPQQDPSPQLRRLALQEQVCFFTIHSSAPHESK